MLPHKKVEIGIIYMWNFEILHKYITSYSYIWTKQIIKITRGRRSRDRMVVGSTTTCAISAYHH